MFKFFFQSPKTTEDLDKHYPVRSDSKNLTASAFRPRVGKRLTADKWKAAFDAKGSVVKFNAILKSIRKGGIEPTLRPQVWEFLLGVFSLESTADERERMRETRRAIYKGLEEECRLVDPVVGTGVIVDFPRVKPDGTEVNPPDNYRGPPLNHPLAGTAGGSSDSGAEGSAAQKREEVLQRAGPDKVVSWRVGLHQIGVDVLRADRHLQFYTNDANAARLMDTLAVYSWFDSEVGYCQGMADLMSPLIVLFPNNADAFWCFERLMRQVRRDFIGSAKSLGVQKELSRLALLLRLLDPDLYAHLDEVGASSLFFTVRPLMAMFRRELSFADSLYFWEMLWAWEYDRRHVEQIMNEDKLALAMATRNPAKCSDRVTFLESQAAYDRRVASTAAVRAARARALAVSGDSLRRPVAVLVPTDTSQVAGMPLEPLPPLPRSITQAASKLERRKSLVKSVAPQATNFSRTRSSKRPAAARRPPKSVNLGAPASAGVEPKSGPVRSGPRPVSGNLVGGAGDGASGVEFMSGELLVGRDGGGGGELLQTGSRPNALVHTDSEANTGRGKGALPPKMRFNTFCVLAVLVGLHNDLVQCDDMDDVMDLFNDTAGAWDVKQLCKKAQQLRQRYVTLQSTKA